MSQPDKLRRVLKIREQNRAKQARLLQQASGVLVEQRQQRDDLAQLLNEYRDLPEGSNRHASQLANRQRFYAQMDRVLQTQQNAVERSEQLLEQARNAYLVTHRQHEGLQQLLTRRELAHRIDLKRRSRKAGPRQAGKTVV